MPQTVGNCDALKWYGDGVNVRSVLRSREVVVHRRCGLLRVAWEFAMFHLHVRMEVWLWIDGSKVFSRSRLKRAKENV